MKQYRKKPIVIEAVQWHGDKLYKGSFYNIEMPIPPVPSKFIRSVRQYVIFGKRLWQIKTLEGWYNLTPNDWIICGIEDEFYPCKPDIFDKTYEEVK